MIWITTGKITPISNLLLELKPKSVSLRQENYLFYFYTHFRTYSAIVLSMKSWLLATGTSYVIACKGTLMIYQVELKLWILAIESKYHL
jgi:hypothetical protein